LESKSNQAKPLSHIHYQEHLLTADTETETCKT